MLRPAMLARLAAVASTPPSAWCFGGDTRRKAEPGSLYSGPSSASEGPALTARPMVAAAGAGPARVGGRP